MPALRRYVAWLLLATLCVAACGEIAGRRRDAPQAARPTLKERTLRRGETPQVEKPIVTGAERMEAYVPRLLHKRIGLVCNHTSLVRGKRLVDTLLARGVDVARLFTPEHGLKGAVDAGATIGHSVDAPTGLPIVSLYGRSRKPSTKQLDGLEVMVFDMQDVGVRCYTYASTMHYVMEACAEHGIPLIVLDRPNPNGYFIDGPVLHEKYKSFVGMHPVPWVHGMTLGELAQMINGEGWLRGGARCDLTVIPCENYTHARHYELPIAPSPNLPTQMSILLYPTLAFLEGTTLSVGRGTDWPFEVAGSPTLQHGYFSFTPSPRPGANHPPHEGALCHGICLSMLPDSTIYDEKGIMIPILQRLYAMQQNGEKFFIPFFDRLAGTPTLRNQLQRNMSADSIRATWREDIALFKKLRRPYLLYE